MERKWRENKDRHEFAWNPEYGWQILRRCKNYNLAVQLYLDEAEKAGDTESIKAFHSLSAKSFGIRKPKNKTRLQLLQDQSNSMEFPLVPNISNGRFIPNRGPKFFKVDTNTKHYRNFYAWYGDLILFPLNPKIEVPRHSFLTALWSLYSVKITRNEKELESVLDENHDHLFALSVVINSSFSKTVILNDLTSLIEKRLDKNAMIREKPRWTKEEFAGYIAVIDLLQLEDLDKKMSHLEVGNRCAPLRVRDSKNAERAKIDWARNTKKYVLKTLLPIFNRPKPSSSPSGLRYRLR